jgi:protein O-mannosyl-transferase
MQGEEFAFKNFFVPITTKKAIVFIVLIGFIVFFNALFGKFTWDDVGFIQNNSEVHTVNISTLFKANNAFNSAGYYRPISATYFAVIYSIFGSQPFYFHLIQIAMHILNAILIFILFSKFFKEKLALFLSIIFLIHPVNVESVAYVGASQSVILLFFGMLAILLDNQIFNKSKKTILVFLLLLLSLLTKETGVLFILIILLYRWLFIGKQTISYIIYSVVTIITYLCIRFFIGNAYLFKIPFIPMAKLSFIERLANIPAIIIYYLKTLVFPKDLIIEQQWAIGQPALTNFYLPLIIIVGLLCLLFLFATKLYGNNKLAFKQLLFFSIWFMSGIGFLLQLFPLDMTVADRWFYFPFIGLLGIIGISISNFIKLKKYKNVTIAAIFIIMILLSIRTIVRNNNWQDTLTLLKHDTKIQTNFDNENNLGMEYSQIGDTPNALIHFQKSVSLDPFELNLSNVGVSFLKLNQLQKVKPFLIQALNAKRYSNLDHKHALSVYVNLGTYFTFYDNHSEAINLLETAVKDYPSSGELYYLLSVSEYLSNKNVQALEHIKKARILNLTPEVDYAYRQMMNNLPLVINKSN